MKKHLVLLAALIFAVSLAFAEKPTTGTIISESSVDCGSHGEKHKETVTLTCQEYVVHTDTTDYRIRQPKQSNQELIPPNTTIQFTMNKGQMKFKANGKKYTFLVVSESAPGAPK